MLLQPPTTCLLLFTTRQRYTLPGLKELDLDTMSKSESIELINKIAPRASEKAGEIAKACGYLPLALRLAASALREQANLSADSLLKRLNDAEKRFTTLELVKATIHVSSDLLAENLQNAFRQLAIFPADLDENASAAIWNIGKNSETTQKLLAAMINANLLNFDINSSRYRMHNLVRYVAEQQLDTKEKYQISYLYSNYYLQFLRFTNEIYLIR